MLKEQLAVIRENRELIEIQKELATHQNDLTVNQNELTINQNELLLDQKELAADQRKIACLQDIKLRRELFEKGYRFELNEEGRKYIFVSLTAQLKYLCSYFKVAQSTARLMLFSYFEKRTLKLTASASASHLSENATKIVSDLSNETRVHIRRSLGWHLSQTPDQLIWPLQPVSQSFSAPQRSLPTHPQLAALLPFL